MKKILWCCLILEIITFTGLVVYEYNKPIIKQQPNVVILCLDTLFESNYFKASIKEYCKKISIMEDRIRYERRQNKN